MASQIIVGIDSGSLDTDIRARINSSSKKKFIEKCSEAGREHSEVIRTIIEMVNSGKIELKKKD